MENSILFELGFDPFYLIIFLFILIILLFGLLVSSNMQYKRLKLSYNTFMRGKDAKSLEESMAKRFHVLDDVMSICKQNKEDIRGLNKSIQRDYQKVGIVKYDAFLEMGGNLSFVLTLLDARDNGFIMNAMHSREGCYTYVKEIVKGKSYIELSAEESESLEKAIFQESYGLDIEVIK
ncbi:MAG: DUF4446 family protein [Eubacteriales bacterium]